MCLAESLSPDGLGKASARFSFSLIPPVCRRAFGGPSDEQFELTGHTCFVNGWIFLCVCACACVCACCPSSLARAPPSAFLAGAWGTSPTAGLSTWSPYAGGFSPSLAAERRAGAAWGGGSRQLGQFPEASFLPQNQTEIRSKGAPMLAVGVGMGPTPAPGTSHLSTPSQGTSGEQN